MPLFPGCEKQEEPKTEPLVVRKTIAPPKQPPPSAGPETAAVPSASTVAAPEPETVSPKIPAARPRTEALPSERPVAVPETVSPKVPAARPRAGALPSERPVAAPETASVPGAPGKVPPTPSVGSAEAGAVPVSPHPANGNYDPEGRVDPFAPLFKPTPTRETVDITPKKKKRRPLTPLEKLDLSQMKLVGVLRMAGGNRALVEESSGKGYVVTKGMYMGRNSGVVKEILKDRVIIEEEIEGFTGKISIEKRELKMEKPVGEF